MNPSRLILLVVAVLSITAGSYAQIAIRQGTWSAQGSVGYSYTDYGGEGYNSREHTISLFPGGTYFLSDQFEIAFSPNYRYTSGKSKFPFYPEGQYSSYSLGFQAGVRYYFVPAEQYYPFIGASLGITWWKRHFEPNLSPPGSVIGAEVGIDYFLSSSFALEPAVRYSRDHNGTFVLSSISVVFGVKYFIIAE